jgi:DNA-binding response OmpR family regulator
MNLLVVEDEERIASFLAKGLRAHGYGVEWVQSGKEALEHAMQEHISLVILDLGLPDLDGLEVLRRLRGGGATIPVLVLSARGRVDDRVEGLNLGADDYVVKPFAFEELLARVRANLRPRTSAAQDVLLQAAGISIDLLEREVMVGGRLVSLSAREFSLLKVFVAHPGEILSRQELLSMAWDMQFDPGTNLVDVYVRYLRRKLGESIIETVHGAGYRLPVDLPGRAAKSSVCLEIAQDREHAPVVVGVQRQVQLHEDRVDVLVDSLGRHDQLAGDRGIGPALRHQRQYLTLARRQPGHRLIAVVVGKHAGHHVRVKDGPPAGHLPDRVDEHADFRDAVLEEVSDAIGTGAHELARVELLDVLAEDQHGHAGPPGPRIDSGHETLVGEGRRHPDVHDGDIWLLFVKRLGERHRITDSRRHVDVMRAQDPRQPVPEQG